MRPASRCALRSLLLLAALLPAGCASLPATLGEEVLVANPITVTAGDYETVWQHTVVTFEKYFDIAYESRWDGKIVAEPRTAPTLFEPWLLDATGPYDRLYSTLQTVRRRAFIDIQPAPTGGFLVSLQVYRELENVRSITADFGGGTLIHSIRPLEERIVDSPIAPIWGWIGLGRDYDLEAKILADLQQCTGGF